MPVDRSESAPSRIGRLIARASNAGLTSTERFTFQNALFTCNAAQLELLDMMPSFYSVLFRLQEYARVYRNPIRDIRLAWGNRPVRSQRSAIADAVASTETVGRGADIPPITQEQLESLGRRPVIQLEQSVTTNDVNEAFIREQAQALGNTSEEASVQPFVVADLRSSSAERPPMTLSLADLAEARATLERSRQEAQGRDDKIDFIRGCLEEIGLGLSNILGGRRLIVQSEPINDPGLLENPKDVLLYEADIMIKKLEQLKEELASPLHPLNLKQALEKASI